jgi:TPP-dependent pyruvate/acetoin dehydrogenase alpha subunit
MIALHRAERIGFHTVSLGEEATIVAAALAARDTDWIFPSAREWYASLARGAPLADYVHHAFGSAHDKAKGHASPDHAPSRSHNVVPPSGVIGAHLPQAVGAAWAAKIMKHDVAVIALFGAEVAPAGDFHNALNFAGVFKPPVVFVCRSKAGVDNSLAPRGVDRAAAYGLASARVDGADALAVLAVVRAALARAREGKGATLIEAVSPALPALAGDVSLAESDVLDLGEGDPLVRLRRAALLAEDAKTVEHGIVEEVRRDLDAAIAAAEHAGAPKAATLFEDVYASVPRHLTVER